MARSPWVFVPPPMLFAGSFVASYVLAPRYDAPAALRIAGGGVVAAGVALMASAVLLFAVRRTTIVPHAQHARELVARGPFRLTRNPMYLGLTFAYVGATLATGSPWSLAALALPLWVMHARVIPYEEASLARTFGDSYLRYQGRVRRWL